MTCTHCAVAIRDEVEKLDGVEHAVVELTAGRLEVHGTQLRDAAVAVALTEAGYEVVP